jgi:hypothetical protein
MVIINSLKNERERYVFAHVFYLLRLWMGSGTFELFSGGKGVFLCFCGPKKMPVDTL